jgi:hypothetical protein
MSLAVDKVVLFDVLIARTHRTHPSRPSSTFSWAELFRLSVNRPSQISLQPGWIVRLCSHGRTPEEFLEPFHC